MTELKPKTDDMNALLSARLGIEIQELDIASPALRDVYFLLQAKGSEKYEAKLKDCLTKAKAEKQRVTPTMIQALVDDDDVLEKKRMEWEALVGASAPTKPPASTKPPAPVGRSMRKNDPAYQAKVASRGEVPWKKDRRSTRVHVQNDVATVAQTHQNHTTELWNRVQLQAGNGQLLQVIASPPRPPKKPSNGDSKKAAEESTLKPTDSEGKLLCDERLDPMEDPTLMSLVQPDFFIKSAQTKSTKPAPAPPVAAPSPAPPVTATKSAAERQAEKAARNAALRKRKGDELGSTAKYSLRTQITRTPWFGMPLMYDWESLGLGVTTGSAAWNEALREECLKDPSLAVPQLDPIECLEKLQAELKMRIVLPPKDSPLHAVMKLSSRQLEEYLDTEDEDSTLANLARLYHGMVAQELDAEYEQDAYNCSTAVEMVEKMRRLENQAAELQKRQRVLEKEVQPDNLLVKKMRGLIQDDVKPPANKFWSPDFAEVMKNRGTEAGFVTWHDMN